MEDHRTAGRTVFCLFVRVSQGLCVPDVALLMFLLIALVSDVRTP